MSNEKSKPDTEMLTWEPLDTLIRYANTDSFYRFVKRWDRFHVGQLVTTDFHQGESKVVRKITKIALWSGSQSGVQVTSVPVRGRSHSACMSVDSEWYVEYTDPNSKETASLEEFF